MSAPLWTAREDARLRSLAAGGLSATAIGRSMGRSKGSITGRLSRIGAKLTNPSPFPPEYHGPHAAKPKPESPRPPAPSVVTALGQLPPPVVATVPVAALSSARTCQWVERLGYPPRFCDAPVWQHTSWCERHHRTVYLRGTARVPGA